MVTTLAALALTQANQPPIINTDRGPRRIERGVSERFLNQMATEPLNRLDLARQVGQGGNTPNGLGRIIVVVRSDGTVRYATAQRRGRFQLTPSTLETFKRELAATDPAALRALPTAATPPSAADGLDFTYYIRMNGRTIRWDAYRYQTTGEEAPTRAFALIRIP